jgi:hypothetical protein
MTTTLAPTELRRALDELEAIESQQRAEQQRQALAESQRAAERAAAERERVLDGIDLGPFDAAVWDALDNLRAAASALAAASAERENAKTQAVETITPFAEQSSRVRLGPVPTLDGYRLTSNRKLEISELTRILAPIVRSIGGSDEHLILVALDQRSRAGNRLAPRQTEGNR